MDKRKLLMLLGGGLGGDAFRLWRPDDSDFVIAWWDPTDTDEVTLDGSGRVMSWSDSISARAVYQTVEEERPIYDGANINGVQAVQFATGDILETSLVAPLVGLPFGDARRGAYVVFQATDIATVNVVFVMGDIVPPIDTSSNYGIVSRPTSSPFFRGYLDDISTGLSQTLLPGITDVVWEGGAGGFVDLTFNGEFNPAWTDYKSLDTQDSLTLGGSNNVIIGDVIFTNGLEPKIERQRFQGFLAHKYGLQGYLPADHPFKINPPKIRKDQGSGRDVVTETGIYIVDETDRIIIT